ncbi:kinase-like domain-containing protein [Haematococcus lacustris]
MSGPKKYPRSTRQESALHLVAREYAGANLSNAKEYWDDTLNIEWGDQDAYEVSKQLGKGKYGEVYASTHLRTKQTCVIKIMRPVKEHRLRREIKILKHVRGGPNVVTLFEVVRDTETKTPCFVFELVDAIGFRDLQSTITDSELRLYMYQLLTALDFCHSKGIMHRDVKPGNVLIDHKRKELRLIDWGLADFYHPGKEYPVRVATRFYKGPELLVDLRDYDYSLDVWGVGCMLAALLFRRPVFFRGDDEFDQLVRISKVLGSEGLYHYCAKYGITLDPRLQQLVGIRAPVPWPRFRNADNAHLCCDEAFDLLSQLLRYDHHERATCSEAMRHPYFAGVRASLAAQQQQLRPVSLPLQPSIKCTPAAQANMQPSQQTCNSQRQQQQQQHQQQQQAGVARPSCRSGPPPSNLTRKEGVVEGSGGSGASSRTSVQHLVFPHPSWPSPSDAGASSSGRGPLALMPDAAAPAGSSPGPLPSLAVPAMLVRGPPAPSHPLGQPVALATA